MSQLRRRIGQRNEDSDEEPLSDLNNNAVATTSSRISNSATHDVAPMNGTQPVSNVPTSDAPSSQISVLIEPGEAGSGIPMVQLDSSAVPRPTELPTADVDDRIRRYLQRPCLTCAKMGKVCLTRAEYKRRLDVLIPQYRRLREEYKPLRAAFSQMANIPKGLKGDESICYMLRFQETKEFQDCRAFLLRTGYLTVKKETQELCFLARNCKNIYVPPNDPFQWSSGLLLLDDDDDDDD
ncbi:hypothetical protein C8Q75DRAFT_735316 [Abortiporus biennis]|nr:hypothetical protein C8Q75DRAFT_735316 [Abortiporus biennis]